MTSSADRCGVCGARLAWARTGRPKLYCGATCRSRAFRARPRQLALDQVLDDMTRLLGPSVGSGTTAST